MDTKLKLGLAGTAGGALGVLGSGISSLRKY